MPKNIVLLSDGTGNSAGRLLKTNVWRVYETLRLDDPTKQVACYDDGVGTSSFKPLAILGGVFGVGMKRNVLRLYRFLCEHYEPGDRIYAFGFSRGAFTIRVLVGLISDQGIIRTRPPVAGPAKPATPPSADAPDTGPAVYGSELARLSRWAYRRFRRHFNQTGGLVFVARALRDVVFRAFELRKPPYSSAFVRPVEWIEFVGVWDTVDAYGLPIDELTDGIDKWVWPLSMPECKISPKVRKGCHVLALDDERNTFHPVLWDEAKLPQTAKHVRDERVSQVWFAGMHSNVGGGYADDALSCVSLNWMTKQAGERGLLFWPELLEHHVAKADPLGRIYDSRGGLKSYYRYNPRRIEWLTNGQVHEQVFFGGRWPKPSPKVTVGRPKVHESVLTRIAAAPEAYAPIVFPENYAVVMDDGRILDGDEHPFERPAERQARARAQEAAWNLVWQRRVAYFVTVLVSVVLALRPFREGAAEAVRTAELGMATRVVLWIGDFLPAIASPWITYYAAEPWELVVGGVALLFVMQRGRKLQAAICDSMRSVWLRTTAATDDELKKIAPPRGFLYRMRTASAYRGAFSVLRREVFPLVFGIATLVWLAGLINRAPFEVINVAGAFCESPGSSASLGRVGDAKTVAFDASESCNATHIPIVAGARYRITLAPEGSWRDGGASVASPAGITWTSPGLTLIQRAAFLTFVPFRRIWSSDWFVPIARIGESGMDHYPLASTSTDITARTSGELFLFVNDAILPISLSPFGFGWSSYYRNNAGTAAVTVTRIEPIKRPPCRDDSDDFDRLAPCERVADRLHQSRNPVS